MKPRSEREILAVRLSSRLPEITEAQRDYCIRHCFEHNAIKRKKADTEYICLECGKTFEADASAKSVVCPHCHTKLKPYVSRRANAKHVTESFQLLTTAGDFQVVRTFYATQTTIPGEPCRYSVDEVTRIFMQQGKSDITIARARRGLSMYVDSYIWKSELELRRASDAYYIHATEVYPRQNILPVLKRNGWCKELKKFSPIHTIDKLLNEPKYETLAKTGRFDIWSGLDRRDVESKWDQVKMMIRHDYRPKDMSMWRDTINLAEELDLDTHSPKYVLPEDLKAMHDMLNKRLEARRAKARKERERERMMEEAEYERLYTKYNKRLLAVVIVAGDITIKPLQNYKEFVEEGEAMHHCVEMYWKHKNCLILSARSGENRLATIELDRKDFRIKQCRAVCNQVPERYDEICDILNAHKGDFLKAMRVRRAS